MKLTTFTCLLILSPVLLSCGHQKEAKEITRAFFKADKVNQESRMVELYPNITNLTSYYKSDTIVIKEVTDLGDDKFKVSLTNKFTNGFGKTTETEIDIFTKPKNAERPGDGYVIYDSKGLTDMSEDPVYQFARRKGYIKGDNLTDQQMASKYQEAATAIVTLAVKFQTYLQENVKISNWNWEKGYYSDYASGRGVVKNNTPYDIPNIKYVVTFYRRNGTEVTQDNGYVTYSKLRPYGMESFSFYTSYVGNATQARIELEFDRAYLLETVARGDFE